MNNPLLSLSEYAKYSNVSERQVHRYIESGKILSVKKDNKTFIVDESFSFVKNEKVRQLIIDTKKIEFDNMIKQAIIEHRFENKSNNKIWSIIHEILSQTKYFRIHGINIRGYNKRSLQRKIASGKTERKTRSDKSSIKNKFLKEPKNFDKLISLVSHFYFKDAMGSISLAFDMAQYYAKSNEEYFEVCCMNKSTSIRQINNHFNASGFKEVHQFMNHYNQFRKGLIYVQGAFTHDIGFMDVYSIDDRKFDVAGSKVWNEEKQCFEQKKVYSWFVFEVKTMMWLAYDIKTKPFKDIDIVKLLMKALGKYGKPKVKIICDQGLGADGAVKNFCNAMGIVLDPQAAYSPTRKATNERPHGFMKYETDNFVEDFVGSNHEKEGRHRSLKLSPEETTAMIHETIKRYDTYMNGFFLDRPRKLPRENTEHLKDGSGRISIRQLFDYYYQSYEPSVVNERELRYAYMHKALSEEFHNGLNFKGAFYMPPIENPLSIVFNRRVYQIDYNPNDLNRIDIRSTEYFINKNTGEEIQKGQYVATLESLISLDADEKKSRVAHYNKIVKKEALLLAKAFVGKSRLGKDLPDGVVAPGGKIISTLKEQEKYVADIIQNRLPVEEITKVIETPVNQTIIYEDEEVNDYINNR